jgi:hypothetical protein
VRAGKVVAGDEEADTHGALLRALGVDLVLVAEGVDETADGDGGLVAPLLVDAFVAEEVALRGAVGDQAGDSGTDVVVQLGDLLRVGRELGLGAAQGCEDGEVARDEANACAAVRNGRARILDLLSGRDRSV